MKQTFFKLSLCLALSIMAVIQAWADGPEMNKVYRVTSVNYDGGWNDYNVPANAFLAEATEAVITVHNAKYINFKTKENYVETNPNLLEYPYNDAGIVGPLTISDDLLNIARKGGIYFNSDGNPDIIVTVLNKDANYVEPGSGGGGGDGGDIDDGGNTDPDHTPNYTYQYDADGDGKLDPTSECPAFGVFVDYNKYPQLTDIPSMYITVYKTDDQGATYDPTKTMDISTTKNDWYYQCRIVIADKYGNMKQRNEMVQLRGRGNSTWTWVNSGKRAFRLKFPEKTKLLVNYDLEKHAEDNGDYADAKSWTLLANAFDKTLIHNAFTYELGKNKLTNLSFCPAYRFVDLYVNNVYYGTYQVSDHVQVDKKRVNVNSSTGWFLELTAPKGGAFLEEPYVMVNNGPLYANVKNPEDAVRESATYNQMAEYLTSMYSKLSSTYDYGHDFNYKTGYRTLVDVNSLIDWFIGEEISANYDATFGNIYTYREAENDKLHFGPMWDLDIAYGGHDGKAMSKIHVWDNSEHQWEGVSNMLRTLWSDKYFVRDLYTRWQQVYDNGNLLNFCDEKINMLAGIVRQSQEKNFTIARPFGAGFTLGINQADNMGGSFNSYDAAIDYFKSYVRARIEWLNSEYSAKYESLGCATLDPCAEFGHTFDTYLLQADDSYRKGCSVCKEAFDPSDTKTYYLFTIYPQSKKSTTQYATSWQPSQSKPNSIAVVEAAQSVVERIEGYNIIAGKKNADGDLTCLDFRLTDGYPYYSENKFVATTAQYKRPLTYAWGTIILPYKYQAASTEWADFYHLSAADLSSSDQGTLFFTPIHPDIDGDASAYTPVVFKAKEGVKELVVNGENVTVKKSSADKTKTSLDGWQLIGSIEKTVFDDVTTAPELEGSDLYFISANKFWQATGKYTNNPFRAYILHSSATPSAVKSFRLEYEGKATSIDSTASTDNAQLAVFQQSDGITLISPTDKSVNIHSVSGALVRTATLHANQPSKIDLPSGIYVVNGMKVNVR